MVKIRLRTDIESFVDRVKPNGKMNLKKAVQQEPAMFFRQSALTLKIFGLWKDCNLDMHKRNTIGIFIVIVIGLGTTISTFSGYCDLKANGDLVGSQMALVISFAIGLSNTKLYSMWNSVAEIKLCLTMLQQFSGRFENQRFIKSALMKYRIYFVAGMIIVTLTLFGFISTPAAEGTKVFPLALKNPVQIVDLLQNPYYQIFYLYQGVTVMLIGYYIIACDTMFCGIMMLIAAFLESINAFFVETFEYKSDHKMTDEEKEKAMIKVMEDFIESIRIIDFVGRIFSLVSLSTFLFNISIIGFATYYASVLPFNNIMFWCMVNGIVLQLFQLAIYCFFGEAVVTQTQKLRYNIYQCDWYNQSKSLNLMIFLTLQRTENEPYFTAGKLVPLSHNTFCEIIKMASSFCMFLFNFKQS